MKFNLRKAHALQLSISRAINEIQLPLTVKITRFENPAEKFTEARAEHDINRINRDALVGILYDIRFLVAKAGSGAGIPALLAQMAEIDKQIELITPLASCKVFAPTNYELKNQFNDMVDEPHGTNQYHRRRDEIEVNLIRKEDGYDVLLAKLRRLKQDLSDTLLQKNVETEIEIPPNSETILKDRGLA